MIPVKCPRCTLEWYSNEEDAGRVQLCSDCVDALKRNRPWGPVQIDAFLIATAAFVLVDLVFIPLAALLPGTFGGALLAYGLVLSIGALIVFSAFTKLFGVGDKADWSLLRWPVMIGLVGLACVLAYYSLGIPAWKEQHSQKKETSILIQPPTRRPNDAGLRNRIARLRRPGPPRRRWHRESRTIHPQNRGSTGPLVGR